MTPVLRTIKLHGFLGKKFAKSVELAGNNMFQLMNGLKARFGPEFQEVIRNNNWHVVEGKLKKGNDLSDESLNKNLNENVIHILPAVQGASAAFRTILGIILIVVGVWFNQPWLVNMGVAMALGGVAEMLNKPKSMDQRKQQDEGGSSIFNSARMVTTQGGPIPVIYGRVRRASSVVISTDFSSEQQFNFYDMDYPPGGGIEP